MSEYIGNNQDGSDAEKRVLQPSLITSYCVHGLQETGKHWPDGVSNVELYCFMQSDVDPLFRSKFNFFHSYPNALAAMAAWKNRPGLVTSVADRLRFQFRGKNIIALATFLPEIMAHERHKAAWKGAQNALLFLIALARELKVKTVEFVAGSRVDGVWRGSLHRDGKVLEAYMVNRMHLDGAIERLLDRLQPIIAEASKTPVVNFALELEPGPLFTINGRKALEALCGGLDARASKVIGLNLDIPHWAFLSDLSPEWVADPRNGIINRILHAHICDHAKGHFADNVMFLHNRREKFQPWVELLKEVCATNPRYSGYLSCEMECCKDTRSLGLCVKHLCGLLNE